MQRWITILFIPYLAILLGHLKMPNSKIKDAVLNCDTEILSEQRLQQMEAFAPDKKEV